MLGMSENGLFENVLYRSRHFLYDTLFQISGPVSGFLAYHLGWNHDYVDDWKSLNDGQSIGVEIETFVDDSYGDVPDKETLGQIVDYINKHNKTESEAEVDLSGPCVELVTKPHVSYDTLEADIRDMYSLMEEAVNNMDVSLYTKAEKLVPLVPKSQSSYDPFSILGDFYDYHCRHGAALHTHIGAKNAEEGIDVVNALRKHMPDIIALSANSQEVMW